MQSSCSPVPLVKAPDHGGWEKPWSEEKAPEVELVALDIHSGSLSPSLSYMKGKLLIHI